MRWYIYIMGILNDSKWQSNGNRMGIIYGGLIPHKNIWIEMVAFVWGFDGQNSGFLGNEPEKKILETTRFPVSILASNAGTSWQPQWMVDATNISTSSTFIHLWGSQGLKCSPLALKKKQKRLTILRMIGANWHSRLWHAWPLMLHCTQVVSPNRKWKMYRYFFRVHGHYEPTSRYTFKHCLFFL